VRDPTAEVIRNLITTQRLGNSVSAEARKLLNALFDDIVAQIARIDPTSPVRAATRRRHLERLLGDIGPLLGKRTDQIERLVRKRLIEIGQQQSEWAGEQLDRTVGIRGVIGQDVVTPQFLRGIIHNDPFRGETLRGWFRSIRNSTLRRVRRQLQIGLAQNETIDDMVRRIRGRGRRRVGGVLQASTRDVEAVVRTGVNFIANSSHFETYRANADVTKTYQYTAVLDGRTSDICQALDGRTWEYDDPDGLRPPQHVNCRSTIVPTVDWEGLGMTPPPEGTRASADGQVPSSTTYEQWLRGQTDAEQNRILGPTKAKLFRSGRINLRDLVRKDGGSVTVAELREAAVRSNTKSASQMRRDIRDREREIAAERVEWATAWDPVSGERVLNRTDNLPDQVSFEPRELNLMRHAIVTHNHPRSTSFSPADVGLAIKYDIRELRIASKEFRYTLLRPEDGWPKLSVVLKRARFIQAETLLRLRQRLLKGEITNRELDLELNHSVWRILFKELGLERTYRRRRAK